MTTSHLLAEISAQRRRARDAVSLVPFSECYAWKFDGNRVSHERDGFFSLVLVRATSNDEVLDSSEILLIDQPEVGILGFLVAPDIDGYKWLIQLKPEPGNIHLTQAAPSVQATESNFRQIHGGRPTSFLEYFTTIRSDTTTVTNTLQSEQGDRFLGKYNRNSVVLVRDLADTPPPEGWIWANSTDLRAALLEDFSLNTDARSVLSCSDWGLISELPGRPFEGLSGRTNFGRQLLYSFGTGPRTEHASKLMRLIETARAAVRLQVGLCAFSQSQSFVFREDGVFRREPGIPEAQFFSVHMPMREVTDWCQPLLISQEMQSVVLICANIAGVLKFLVRPFTEPGHLTGPQFGPSLQSGTGNDKDNQVSISEHLSHCRLVAEVLQSDEGGRFFQSICRYQIVELNPSSELPTRHHHQAWLTLAELKAGLAIQGCFTNELRNAISLLLAWA